MVHRLALFIGATGAFGVIALALAMGGLAAQRPITSDALTPLSKSDALAGGSTDPADSPNTLPDQAGDSPTAHDPLVDTVYVLPAADPPVVHVRRRAHNSDDQQPAAPRARADNGQDDSSASDDKDDGDEADEPEDDESEGARDQAHEDEHDDDGGDD